MLKRSCHFLITLVLVCFCVRRSAAQYDTTWVPFRLTVVDGQDTVRTGVPIYFTNAGKTWRSDFNDSLQCLEVRNVDSLADVHLLYRNRHLFWKSVEMVWMIGRLQLIVLYDAASSDTGYRFIADRAGCFFDADIGSYPDPAPSTNTIIRTRGFLDERMHIDVERSATGPRIKTATTVTARKTRFSDHIDLDTAVTKYDSAGKPDDDHRYVYHVFPAWDSTVKWKDEQGHSIVDYRSAAGRDTIITRRILNPGIPLRFQGDLEGLPGAGLRLLRKQTSPALVFHLQHNGRDTLSVDTSFAGKFLWWRRKISFSGKTKWYHSYNRISRRSCRYRYDTRQRYWALDDDSHFSKAGRLTKLRRQRNVVRAQGNSWPHFTSHYEYYSNGLLKEETETYSDDPEYFVQKRYFYEYYL